MVRSWSRAALEGVHYSLRKGRDNRIAAIFPQAVMIAERSVCQSSQRWNGFLRLQRLWHAGLRSHEISP
jgi:hypothetical protein